MREAQGHQGPVQAEGGHVGAVLQTPAGVEEVARGTQQDHRPHPPQVGRAAQQALHVQPAVAAPQEGRPPPVYPREGPRAGLLQPAGQVLHVSLRLEAVRRTGGQHGVPRLRQGQAGALPLRRRAGVDGQQQGPARPLPPPGAPALRPRPPPPAPTGAGGRGLPGVSRIPAALALPAPRPPPGPPLRYCPARRSAAPPPGPHPASPAPARPGSAGGGRSSPAPQGPGGRPRRRSRLRSRGRSRDRPGAPGGRPPGPPPRRGRAPASRVARRCPAGRRRTPGRPRRGRSPPRGRPR